MRKPHRNIYQQPTKEELDELETIDSIEEVSGYSWRDLNYQFSFMGGLYGQSKTQSNDFR